MASKIMLFLALIILVPLASAQVIWSAGMETGDMNEWYSDSGGGEFNSGSATSEASTDFAHTGQYSARLTAFTPPTSGARLFRWNEGNSNPALYYSTWFYFPQVYDTPAGWWNVFQWKSRTCPGCHPDPFFVLNVERQGADMTFYLYDWQNRVSYSPSPSVTIPVGQWFHIEAYQTCTNSASDQVRFWMDDVLIYDIQNVRTQYSGGTCEWSLDDYSAEVTPSPTIIYVDDAAISTTKVGAGSSPPSCSCSDNSCEAGDTGRICNGCNYVTAPAESCNDADDDCDGIIDNGVLNACGACGAVPTEICTGSFDEDCDGTVDCSDTDCSTDSACTPSCNCSSWADNTCGAGTCSSNEMQQTRTCTGSCAGQPITQCITDASCTAPPTCPDSSCNGGETCSTCPTDCGVCGPICGDSNCDGGETCSSCSVDCGACPPPPSNNPGDVNSDSMVDLADLVMMTINLGSSGFDPITDINSDGRVNIFDMVVVARNYGNDYSTPPTPTSLVAYYDFNENSGNILNDQSGNGNHGTINGATWVTGQTGGALDFDGIDDFAVVDSLADYVFNDMSVVLWARPDAFVSGPSVTAMWGSLWFFPNLNGWHFLVPGVCDVLVLNIFSSGSWVHLAGILEEGVSCRLYLNGDLVGETPTTGSFVPSGNPLTIGSSNSTYNFYDGIIDEVKFYNVALSQAEIQEDMNS